MAKLPFAGVIPLTTTNRSRCLYRSTSFCVASCCTSFHKASCASGISAFWPTGGAKRFCRFAFSCWVQPKNRKLNNTLLPRKTRPVFGAVPSVVAHEGRRTIDACRNPTPLSAAGHRCRMNSLSAIRIDRVSRHGPYLSAFPPNRSLRSAYSVTLFKILCRRSQQIAPSCRVLCSVAQSPCTQTPLLPTFEFA